MICRYVSIIKLYNPSRWLDGSESFGEVKQMLVPEQIAVIEGSSGNHDLTLFYTDAQGTEQELKYKGGASAAHAYNQAGSSYNETQYQQGQRYVFSSSTTGVLAGEVIAVGSLKLSVHNGDSWDPVGETRVKARLYSPCAGVKLAEQVLYGSDRLGVYRAEKVLEVSTSTGTATTVSSEGRATIIEDISISSYEQINEYVLAEGVEMTVTEGFSYSYQESQEEFHIHFGEIKSKGQYYAKAIGKKQYELKDHLGNVRVLVSDRKLAGADTDGDGLAESKAEVLASYNYYAFGMMQPGRTFEGSADYRYGYNTQEKVEEIAGAGNHYTAPFWEYDPRVVTRWNRDPVTYSWQSPYAINNNNPIIFSDPLGLFGSRKEARQYRKEHNTGGRIRIDNEGYYSIDNKKAGTSIFKDMESGKVWTAALVTAKHPDHKTTIPFQLGVEWLTGGPKSRDFTSGDYTVELYKQHEHYQNALSDVTKKLKTHPTNAPNPDYGYPYELDGIEGVGKYVKDYSTLATGGTTGNLMFTYLGSHSLWIEVTANDIERRVATVIFTVHNMSTLESGTRLPVIGYQEWYQNSVGNFLNTKVAGRTGPTSETEQVFQWTETIKY